MNTRAMANSPFVHANSSSILANAVKPSMWCGIGLCLWLVGTASVNAQTVEPEPEPEHAANVIVDSDSAWRITPALETWVYSGRQSVRGDSVLNPGNRVAHLAEAQNVLDVRSNLRVENGPFEAVLSPRWLGQIQRIEQSGQTLTRTHDDTLKLAQGFVRYKAQDVSLTVGRELLTWGPANFRSPSNPYYFDAGRTNPLAALPGIDMVRHTLGLRSWRVTSAYVVANDQVQPMQVLGHAPLLKVDQQGESHLLSLIVSQPRGQAAFVGGFAQVNLDDAWLLYGEFGSAREPKNRLANTQPPRTQTSLVGASYTLERGPIMAAEYLHHSGGYSAAQQTQLFDQAAATNALLPTQPAAAASLGQALSQLPRLMGRDYAWLSVQSNPQENQLYWRLGWAQNLSDRSGQATAYLEKNYWPKVSVFVSLALNTGSPRTDYGMLMRSSTMLGVKLFLL